MEQDVEARREFAAALRLLSDLKNEEGNQQFLTRGDIAKLYAACEQAIKGV